MLSKTRLAKNAAGVSWEGWGRAGGAVNSPVGLGCSPKKFACFTPILACNVFYFDSWYAGPYPGLSSGTPVLGNVGFVYTNDAL